MFEQDFTEVSQIPIWKFQVLFGLTVLFAIFIFRRQVVKGFLYIPIFIGFSGLFEYLGALPIRLFLLFIFVSVIYYLYRFSKPILKNKILLIYFIFSLFFILSMSYSGFSAPLSDLRQFILYSLPIAFFVYFNRIRMSRERLYKITDVVLTVFHIQMFAALVKLLLIGVNEKIVGVFTIMGAGSASVFPVIYFMLRWFKNKGELKRIDWILIIASLIIPILSGKRAVWFLFPLTILVFNLIYGKIRFKVNHLIVLLLVPFVFYFGVRLNSSLNPEHKVGGSFDYEYFMDYVISYNLGGNKTVNNDVGTGRMGNNIFYLNKIFTSFTDKDLLLGYGSKLYLSTSGKGNINISLFGFKSKFMLTGWLVLLIRYGFFVMLIYTYLIFNVFRIIPVRRDRFLVSFVFVTWFFFYSGTIIFDSLMSLGFILSIFLASNPYNFVKKA